MQDRPNILLIMTDQQSAFAMSAAGNPDVHTPNMDRLAAEGVLFSQTYCTQPLCTPCRGSMFAGLMPHVCGTPRNGMPIREELRPRELGRVLEAGGYECLYGGKWHVPEGRMPQENDHGFRSICGFNDDELAAACAERFRTYASAEPGKSKPFFMVASFDNPHNICEYARNMALPWGDIGTPPPVEDCPNLPPNFAAPPFEPEIVRIEQQCNWVVNPVPNKTDEDWRRLRWGYFRLVEKVDREVGRILDALDAAGLTGNTVVVFTSDHGDGHGAHRWNQKSILYEEVVRVPMIIRAPGGRAGVTDADHLVSNALDLFPTLCDYAGLEPPADLPGLSLRPLVEATEVDEWRDALFVETVFDGTRGYSTQGRSVRTSRFKYIVYERGKYNEQLFDLQADPGEMVNLAVSSRFADELARHRRLLQEEMARTGDRFRAPLLSDGHGWR